MKSEPYHIVSQHLTGKIFFVDFLNYSCAKRVIRVIRAVVSVQLKTDDECCPKTEGRDGRSSSSYETRSLKVKVDRSTSDSDESVYGIEY